MAGSGDSEAGDSEGGAEMSDLSDSIKAITSSLKYATFHDDSDEAITLWSFWEIVKGAAGGRSVGKDPLAWHDEIGPYVEAAREQWRKLP